ncbi:MAG TPA: 30S ribosomal protein S20 [Bacillales bacterium]|nr:30S ribosomal protein S20 [Bacillales bacterium]
MPVIQSAIKRVRTNEKSRSHNIAIKSEMRAAIKDFEAKVGQNNLEEAKQAYAVAARKLDKAAQKNIIHVNKAARFKSRFARKLNALSK